MRPIIVFVDDEPRLIDSYKRELEFDYKVKFISKIDDFLKFMETEIQKIDLLILDVMMPPGSNQELNSISTHKGMKTGFVLYKMIRERHSLLPIILFTNFTRDEQNQITKSIMQDKKAKFLHKEDCLPFELADEIESFL